MIINKKTININYKQNEFSSYLKHFPLLFFQAWPTDRPTDGLKLVYRCYGAPKETFYARQKNRHEYLINDSLAVKKRQSLKIHDGFQVLQFLSFFFHSSWLSIFLLKNFWNYILKMAAKKISNLACIMHHSILTKSESMQLLNGKQLSILHASIFVIWKQLEFENNFLILESLQVQAQKKTYIEIGWGTHIHIRYAWGNHEHYVMRESNHNFDVYCYTIFNWEQKKIM